ncbi:hypothetical protein QBC34DRAFT_417433 [Podospora aff. communis PSN243]|uniref:Uncharacterized protein n=1 Tax=Podospora aff. communis PSN243 TaxID=3040156 RepID=A0AAV9G745_9PEZI|nr:hypothetical protein QBC34DRAFT_417433 [Podospora aff. communis PSN243]
MANIRLSLFTLLMAATSVFAAASPDITDLLARQAPGTPQFDCHSACGSTISGSRVEGHCTNETWTGNYEKCLECALEFDIWKHYSTTIGNAAKTCGLTAVPSPAAGASSTAGPSASGPAPSGSGTPTPTAPSTTGGTTAAATTASTAGAVVFATAVPPLVAGVLMAMAAL